MYGYRRLEPIPSQEELEAFYENDYYDSAFAGARAPDLKRLLEGGEAAERERAWLRETLYDDIAAQLSTHGKGKRVLDIGCGLGDLLQRLDEHGFDARGLEPNEQAAQLARERGLVVSTQSVGELVAQASGDSASFDAVILLHVLEHVPNPAGILREIHSLLEPGGLLYIWVPNDFNALQLAAQSKLGVDPWWVASPDHINYFTKESLSALVRRVGFATIDIQADFPMELFLLMGLDYIANPDVGATCHGYRVEAERAMPPEVRRELFHSFAASGIGRDLRVLVRKVERAGSDSPSADLAESPITGTREGYAYTPLRRTDIEALRQFRNAQLSVLRQHEPISAAQQERWYEEIVAPTQLEREPSLMLVSILADERFIGYGGLTNIDWNARRAEVSFLVDPARAGEPEVYRGDMSMFLDFLKQWAFDELGLNRLFTETYAFRDFHIAILEQAGFTPEGRLHEHVVIDGEAIDSVMHGCLASDRHRG